MAKTQQELKAEADRRYEAFVRSLERDHWGEFIAVTADGHMILGDDLDDLAIRAHEEFGSGVWMFRVGERTAGKVR